MTYGKSVFCFFCKPPAHPYVNGFIKLAVHYLPNNRRKKINRHGLPTLSGGKRLSLTVAFGKAGSLHFHKNAFQPIARDFPLLAPTRVASALPGSWAKITLLKKKKRNLPFALEGLL